MIANLYLLGYNNGVLQVGSLAQLVEQRPEEPCVPSSSLGGATKKKSDISIGLFLFIARI